MSIQSRLKKTIKKTLTSSLFTPLHRYLAGQCTCLMYHRIINEQKHPEGYHGTYNLTVSDSHFEEQMAYLSANYHCLDISTAIDQLKSGSLQRNSVIVSFDDGYIDNLTLALPILKKHSVPATIYITTGFIERTATLWWYEHRYIVEQLDKLEFNWQNKSFKWSLNTQQQKEMAILELDTLFKQLNLSQQQSIMTILRQFLTNQFSYDADLLNWEQLKLLDQEELITIGAHTVNHPVMKQLNEQVLLEELTQSRTNLEQYLNHSVKHFAYPFGGHEHASQREFFAVAKLQYESAFTTQWGHISQRDTDKVFCLPRIDIHYCDTLTDFCWKLRGLQACYEKLRA